jgi:twitching motility two-component system response regulator PilH
MSNESICPYCHVPQAFTRKPSDPPGEVYCPNCGGPLPWGPAPAAQPPTVLCIDDDPLVLYFYRDFLDRHGYRVLTATDGLAGLTLAHQDRPDALLLDVMLRGLSGFDICRKFRADPVLHALPIILITVWDHASVATIGHEAGATLTLQKPADPETILTALAGVLGPRTDHPAR